MRDGVRVEQLVRGEPSAAYERTWAPGQHELDPRLLAGARAVVNLNGASIGRLPWTRSYRAKLAKSRIDSTRTIAEALSKLGADAPLLVSASAVGYYGDRPGERLTEDSGPGRTFLAELCVEWERTARDAAPDSRIAFVRTAPIIHRQGVLKPLILLTKLGISGPLAGGGQTWPWISLEDEVRAIRHLIDEELTGPFNLCGPVPATANDLGRELARHQRRPFVFPVPAGLLRIALGTDAAEGLLLSDADVRPQALLDTGFRFEHGSIGDAIAAAFAAGAESSREESEPVNAG